MANPHKLVSIPASHYVEKARWGLDIAGVQYVEEKYPPLLHYIGTKMSSGTKTVPVLQCPSGTYITDSTDILQYVSSNFLPAASLYPSEPPKREEVDQYVTTFSKKLGPYARVTAYLYLFENDPLCLEILTTGQKMERWKSTVFGVFWPGIKFLMRKGMRVTPANAAICLAKIEKLFEEVAEKLADGRTFLVGNEFTAADLTFAAMASPLLLPDGYGAALPSLDQVPADFPGRALRNTPAGKHALRMYELHRNPHDVPTSR